jgi:hypothetical protein
MDFKNMLNSLTMLSESTDVSNKTTEGRVHKGTYGTSYDGNDDKKEKTSDVPRGRGRPKKNSDDSGEVKSYDTTSLHGVFGGGQKPKKEVGKTSKKHSLKEYFEEASNGNAQLAEVDTGQYDARKSTSKGETTPEQEKEFRKKVQAYGKDLEKRQNEKKQGMTEQEQVTIAPAQQNTQVIKQGQKTLGTVTNPQLAQQIKQSIGKGEMSLNPEEMEEGLGDMARKVGSVAKTGISAALNKLGHGSDKELLQKLQQQADMRGMNHGKPSMGYSDVEKRLEEKAPPGAKAERMVKHIKKSYSKDGKLTPKEKSIAYATAHKAHNAGKVEESFVYEGVILTEGALKDLVMNLMTDLETGPRGYNINTAVEMQDRGMAQRIIDKTLAHGERYKRLAGTLKSQLRDAALEEFGFIEYEKSLEEANTDPDFDFDIPLIDPVMPAKKPSIFTKSNPMMNKSMGSMNGMNRLEQTLNPFESKNMKDIQLESWNNQLNAMLTEGITVSSSTGQQGSPDSVSVTASDADAQALLQVLRQAGIGGFGAGETPAQGFGSPMSVQVGTEPSGTGTDPEMSPAVVGDGDDMLSLIKKMTGIQNSEPESETDYEDEIDSDDSTSLEPADDEDNNQEKTSEGNAFGDEVRQKKADNIPDSQQRIKTGGQNLPVKEDDVEESNKFLGNLAKAREAGKKEADLDGDGDMEKVREDDKTCESCGTMESECSHGKQVEEAFANDAGGNAMADIEIAKLKHLLSMGNDLHKMKSDQTVGNPARVSVRESIKQWAKLSGIK